MKFLTWLWNRGKPTFVPETSDRETVDVSTALTPQKVDAIMRAANSGDTRDQCRLAAELLEHNIEIAQAVSTRINAVLGLHWSFEPGDDTPAAKQAAEQLAREIKAVGSGDNFDELLEDMMGAVLPGFAISEILTGACWLIIVAAHRNRVSGGAVGNGLHLHQINLMGRGGLYFR